MTDRSDELRTADEALRLRLFDEAQAEARCEAFSDAIGSESDFFESEEPVEDEIPDDLLELAERLASESRSLAMTYPAESSRRLPVGEGALVETSALEAKPVGDVREDVAPPARSRFGIGMAAAAGLAAIVGAAIYAATSGGLRDSVADSNVPVVDLPNVSPSPSTNSASRPEVAGVPVRTVSLSLANDGDYRRLESLLRDRSEPEREAMFDLLDKEGGGETTAVRISF